MSIRPHCFKHLLWPSFHLVLGIAATQLSLSSRIPLSPQSTLPMDSDELTGDNFQHTAAPEYNYGDVNGNNDYAAPALLGPKAISGSMVAVGMDYNQPIKFVLGGILDLQSCLESSSSYWTTLTSAKGTLTPPSLLENIAVWQMMKCWDTRAAVALAGTIKVTSTASGDDCTAGARVWV